jgi:hypothetical protein
MSAVRLFTAQDAIRATEKVQDLRQRQEQWPYVHIFPPPDSIPVHQLTLVPVAVPATDSAQVEVLLYRVPSGFSFIMTAIVQQYQGGTFTWGNGSWTIDRNTPVGVANVQASPVQGLTNIPVPLGSFIESGPWQLPRAYVFKPLDEIRSKFTQGIAPASTPNGLLVSGFFGYLVPWTDTE